MNFRTVARRTNIVLLALLFVAAGVLHVTHTEYYLKIMPPFLPQHRLLVQISGVCEIVGGIGLLIPRLRHLAGYALVALLVAVFPANIHLALHPHLFPNIPPVLLWLRLPLQFAFMYWVWWSASRRG